MSYHTQLGVLFLILTFKPTKLQYVFVVLFLKQAVQGWNYKYTPSQASLELTDTNLGENKLNVPTSSELGGLGNRLITSCQPYLSILRLARRNESNLSRKLKNEYLAGHGGEPL